MSYRQKQLALVIGGLLVVGVLLFFLYSYFFSGKTTVDQTGLLPGNPSGPTTFPTTPNTPPTKNEGGGQGDTSEPTLFQIHEKPIVSFVVFVRGITSYARFIEQGSGHVYEYNFNTKEKIRISNTSIPQIQMASWAKNGNTIAFQYLEKGIVRSAVGELATTSTEGSFKKLTFLPSNLTSLAVSPGGESIIYSGINKDNGAVAVANKDGTQVHLIYSSPLTRLLVSWPSRETVLIETPLSALGGAAFSINLRTGAQKTLVATQNQFAGLVGAADGTTYLYTPAWSKGTTRLDTKDDTEFASFAMNTIPDKCSFIATSTDYALCGSGDGPNTPILTHLESWLRGEGFTDDRIYLINFKQAFWSSPIRIEDLGDKTFDVEHIEGDATFRFSAFKEKEGQTLWGIRLSPDLFL